MRSKLGDRRTENQSADQSANMGSVIYAREHAPKDRD